VGKNVGQLIEYDCNIEREFATPVGYAKDFAYTLYYASILRMKERCIIQQNQKVINFKKATGKESNVSKPIGRHKYNRLTDLKIRKLKKAGRYGDGHGLYLVVRPNGSKCWLLRIVINRRRRDISLGGYPAISLTEARVEALKMMGQAKQGLDPILLRRKAKRLIPTFEEAAREVHLNSIPAWKETKAISQWINSLENYAFPKIGSMRVNDVRPPDVISVLAPIWIEKHSTADKVRQRMSRVFDWAKTQEFLTNENPVRGIKQGLPKYEGKVKHFESLSYEEIAQFLIALKSSSQSTNVKLGLEFLILTACRSGELRYAEWSEIDFEKKLWVSPESKMKANREHIVPLTKRCIEILEAIKPISGRGAYIFPSSQNWSKPMSDATLSKAVKKGLGYPVTVHGFRATFSDWASETTNYPREVIEMALAHSNPNKTEAAYKRGSLLEKRSALMRDWNKFCGALSSA